MNFELTISGLNIVAVMANEPRPPHPIAVDVVSPIVHMHRARLSYLPEDCSPARGFKSELAVTPLGQKIASEFCKAHHYELRFVNDPYGSARKFNLKWSPNYYNEPLTDECMDWLPSPEDLGFDQFDLSKASRGHYSRFSLIPADICCGEMTRSNKKTSDTLLWHFPAVNVTKALANRIVYRARDISSVMILRDGAVILASNNFKTDQTLRMCLSNDMEYVPGDYNSEQQTLDHLKHLDGFLKLKNPPFQPPRIYPRDGRDQRTGHPICNGIVAVGKHGGTI